MSARLDPEAADNIAQLLAGLGFRTALDLRLLGGGPEAEELMGELQADGRLSIGHRAKVRLLIGNRAHLRRLGAAPQHEGHGNKMRWMDAAVPGQEGNEEPRPRRVLQGKADDSMSMDTIAIVPVHCSRRRGRVPSTGTRARAPAYLSPF